VPADHFNNLFDETELTADLRKLAHKVHADARRVTDLSEQAFHDAVRAHYAVLKLMDRHEADAITIECLFLKHRKPCLSFSMNNGAMVPCGCENDLNATLTLMLGTNLFGRGGFQHNPEFDTEENLYFGSHCTCTTHLHGPGKRPAKYDLRPFFHQLPKSLALDVQWPEGEPVTLLKFEGDKPRLNAWSGSVISSPGCPPAGGCATRVLVKLDGVGNVCDTYSGPHPVLFCGDFARHAKAFAKLYELELRTNG
jgi:L-fucose isomerase-like protein